MNNQATGSHYGINFLSEEWLPVPVGIFGESYEVSSLGRVRGLNRIATGTTKKMRIKGRVLRARVRKDGYLTVNFSFNGRGSQFAVHRLVALAFVDNKACNPVVNHKNGVKTDNRASNLEWVTRQQNVDHAISNGLMKVSGEHNAQFKGAIRAVELKTKQYIDFVGKKSLISFGFNHSSVYACLAGRRKSHRGFTFHRIKTAEVMAC